MIKISLNSKFIVDVDSGPGDPESRLTNIYTSLHLIGPFNRSFRGQSENDDYLQLTPANTNPHYNKIMIGTMNVVEISSTQGFIKGSWKMEVNYLELLSPHTPPVYEIVSQKAEAEGGWDDNVTS